MKVIWVLENRDINQLGRQTAVQTEGSARA
jgi:hypothetical protein